MTEFSVGQRVKHRVANWNLSGVIVEKEGAIMLGDAVLISPRYVVNWDDGDIGPRLRGDDLVAEKESEPCATQ